MSPTAVIQVVVLLACSWPVLRLLARPSFRRVAPLHWWALVIAGLVAAAVILILAVYQPIGLSFVIVVVVLLCGASTWRSRLSFGRSRGVPPGSLSPWRSVEAIVERNFYKDQGTQHGPIFKMALFQVRS